MLCLANTFRNNHVLQMMHYGGTRVSSPWLLYQRTNICGAARKKHAIKYTPFVPPCYTDHDQMNMTLKRPMSPHLTIYAPTLQTLTSIFQRISGLALTFYAVLLAGGTLFLPHGVETYVSVIQSLNLGWLSTFLLKIILGAPFGFHYWNGIRFCAWNTGRWLSQKEVVETARKSWVAAAAVVLFFAIL